MLGLLVIGVVLILIGCFGLYLVWAMGQRQGNRDSRSASQAQELPTHYATNPVYFYQCLLQPSAESPVTKHLTPRRQDQSARVEGAEPAPEKGGYSLAACIKAQVVIGENTRQVLLENVLDLGANALKVREIRAEVKDICCDVICDKVIVQGIIHKQIFFVGEDNMVYHRSEDVPFSTFLDIPGAEPGMNCHVEVCIEHIVHHLLTPTLLQQKVIFEVFAKVTDTQNLQVTIGPGPLVVIDEVVAKVTGQLLEEETVELEVPARKISVIRAKIKYITFEPICDKVIIQGIIHNHIFFIDDENIERRSP